ncbi:hypothetical protein BJX66DRAFT_303353 [Aspergillus keveii]|uniref:Secreted protein n=1 Tax=Aspergillus keveii TaxID=714993 RepID=A0ABR4G7W2_9EURO
MLNGSLYNALVLLYCPWTRLAISPIHQLMTLRFLLKVSPIRLTVTASRSVRENCSSSGEPSIMFYGFQTDEQVIFPAHSQRHPDT